MMKKLEEPESMDDCEYFSRRSLEGIEHKFVIWVLKSDPAKMNINYKCGKCGNEGSVTDEFKLPFKFNCSKCGVEIVVKPLKGKKKGIKK
jgi:DNA-directed RNA polymerase subunit RPC12/RpoP